MKNNKQTRLNTFPHVATGKYNSKKKVGNKHTQEKKPSQKLSITLHLV